MNPLSMAHHYFIWATSPVVYQGPGKPRLFTRLNRRLIEKGIWAPWMFTRKECHDHFLSLDNTDTHGNRPVDYAQKDTAITEAMYRFMLPEVQPSDSVLELGCNAGANLAYLHTKGFQRFFAIEINQKAINQMFETFPDVFQNTAMVTGTFETQLPWLPDELVDVSFTMGTSMHIHPSSNFVFKDLVRVTRKYIVTVEHEVAGCAYVFPRNYQRVFERLGCVQNRAMEITEDTRPALSSYRGCTMRLFKKEVA